MAVFTSVATVSARYYEKRNRSVAEFNIRQMCESLGRTPPTWDEFKAMSKSDVVNMALRLHREFPE